MTVLKVFKIKSLLPLYQFDKIEVEQTKTWSFDNPPSRVTFKQKKGRQP